MKNNGFNIRAFSLGNPVPAVATKAADLSTGLAFHIGFEVLAGYVGPAVVELWSCPATAGSNGCVPDFAAGAQILEADICDIMGTLYGDAVNFPTTLVAGDYVWARPRCFPKGHKFLYLKGASGDIAHLSAVAAFSELR